MWSRPVLFLNWRDCLGDPWAPSPARPSAAGWSSRFRPTGTGLRTEAARCSAAWHLPGRPPANISKPWYAPHAPLGATQHSVVGDGLASCAIAPPTLAARGWPDPDQSASPEASEQPQGVLCETLGPRRAAVALVKSSAARYSTAEAANAAATTTGTPPACCKLAFDARKRNAMGRN